MVRVGMALVMVVACTHEPVERAPPRQVPSQPPPPAASPIPAPPPMPLPAPEPAKPMRTDLSPTAAKLAAVETFALGSVGVTGAMSGGERLTRELATEPDAIVMFKRLSTDPNRVARLYAFWALRRLDRMGALRYLSDLNSDSTVVETINGCMIEREETRELLELVVRHPMRARAK